MSNLHDAEYQVSDSDLDELDEDELEEEDKGGVGALKGSINKPRHTHISVKTLYEMIQLGNVELDPDYQRDVVWTEPKMIGLIQSLFLNYYVPPVIFAIEQIIDDFGEAAEKRVAIDGKQRCTSIQRFMDGEIPYKTMSGEKFFYRTGSGRGKQLPKSLKDRFDMLQIIVVEYDGVAESVQRDIFQRVQLGVALTAAEKLQAIPGPWTEYIGMLVKKYVLEEGTLRDSLTWDTKRGRPFQHILSMALLCHEPQRMGKPPTATELTKWLDRTDKPDEGFRRKLDTAMSIFVNIAVNYKGIAFEQANSKVLAPVEFWFTGFLIFNRMGSTPVVVLARQIAEMRNFVRSKHRDIFTNSSVCRSFYDFFAKLPPYKAGANEQVAAAEWEGEEPEYSAATAQKRKRDEREEELDPDYRGAPVPRNGKAPSLVVAESIRSRAKAKSTPPIPKITRPPVESVPAVRPNATSMDAAPITASNTNVDPMYQRPPAGMTVDSPAWQRYLAYKEWQKKNPGI